MTMRFGSSACLAALLACAAAAPDNYYVTVIAANGSTAVGVVANSSFGDHAFSIHPQAGGAPAHGSAGPECEWDGFRGSCVPEHRCLTSLDRESPKHQECASGGGDAERSICCTDCELVNDTSNAVFKPDSGLGLYWKTGQKAWDKCLRNLVTLPTKCHPHRRGNVQRWRDEARRCHRHRVTGEGRLSPDPGGRGYAHSAVLGYGSSYVFSMAWFCFGTLISERFVLSAAQCYRSETDRGGYAMYAVLGAFRRSSDAAAQERLQHKVISKYHPHPEFVAPYGSNDIALYETDSPISMNKFVSPACLWSGPSAGPEPRTLHLATWRDLRNGTPADELSLAVVRRYDAAECEAQYPPHWDAKGEWFGFDERLHLCYGDKNMGQTCMIHGGEGLVARQVSSCVHSVVGVRTFDRNCRDSNGVEIYTRVAPYVPWIESIVWPD